MCGPPYAGWLSLLLPGVPGRKSGARRMGDLRIVLRAFAPIEHAVVPHDANRSAPQVMSYASEGCCRLLGVAPGLCQDRVAGLLDGVEDIPGNQAVGVGLKSESLCESASVELVEGAVLVLTARINQRECRCCADFGFVKSLLFEAVAFRDMAIGCDLADPQVV